MIFSKLNVIGCGGHARSVINLLEKNNYQIDGVYDDVYTKELDERISGYELKGTFPDNDMNVVLAIGDNKKRKKILETVFEKVYPENICHPSVLIENRVFIGKSNLVFAGVISNSEVKIGDNNILNSGCII